MIPVEAFEAAAKAIEETLQTGEGVRDIARAALEAASPYMMDQATAAEPLSSEVARRACAEPVWDGPYKMTCGHIIVRGKCVRHGENGATYEIRTGPNAR